MDEWTTGNRRFANVNLHGNLKTYCLGMIRAKGSMPAERCKELVDNLLKDFGLKYKNIVGITTDAAKVRVGKRD